jgi:hypothetical protein
MDKQGVLHIVRLTIEPDTGTSIYAITYAPYDQRGGALPAREVRGEDVLVSFLKQIRLDDPTISAVLSSLRISGRASVPNIALSDEQLKRYGLSEMGILQSILSYLST